MGLVFNPFTGTFDFTGGTGGGTGTPGAPDTSVQFNEGGSFGGDAEFTWVTATKTLEVIGPANTGAVNVAFPSDYSGVAFFVGKDGFAPGTDGFYLQGPGLWATDAGFTGSLTFNPSGELILSGVLGVGVDPSTIGAKTVASYRALTNAASSGSETANVLQVDITETDLADTDSLVNLGIITTFGLGGAASVGRPVIRNETLTVEGCGDTDCEYNIQTSQLFINIGTGFTQSAGPVGFLTWGDDRLEGPIAVQPRQFLGSGFCGNNYYNGNPVSGSSVLDHVYTFPGIANEATHAAADTFPIQVGHWIGGKSRASAVDGVGFTTALLIGGGITSVLTDSILGTGVHIRDYTTYGILIDNPSGSPTASISADGLVLAGTFRPTSNYKSVDDTAGATGTDTAGTIFKNGLATTVGSSGGSGADDFAFFCGQ